MTLRGQVLRVWKGYRSAQLGWILTADALSGDALGNGLYLVIFSPARAQVEVWRARFGPRVSVLSVSDPSNARLVTTCSAGVIGGPDLPLQSQCFLVHSCDTPTGDEGTVVRALCAVL